MSANSMKAEILRSSRQREKKIKGVKRFLGFFLVFIIISFFFFLLNLDFLRLTDFQLLGQTSYDLTNINRVIKEELVGYHFQIIPKNSVFFFSKTRLESLLKQKFPGLRLVEINSPNLNTLVINLKENEEKVLWCHTSADDKRCYYLNEEGLVYQIAPNFSVALVLEFDSPTKVEKLNTLVIDPIDLAQVKSFLNYLKIKLIDWPIPDSKYKISRVKVLPYHDFEVLLVSSVDRYDSWNLLFNARKPTEQLITNITALTKDKVFTAEWSSQKKLDYLDLRFDNKAFYKFQ